MFETIDCDTNRWQKKDVFVCPDSVTIDTVYVLMTVNQI